MFKLPTHKKLNLILINKFHNHPFHMVTNSPWPLYTSLSLMITLVGVVKWWHEFSMNLFILGFISTTLSIFQWWRDVVRESTFQGMHTNTVKTLLKTGMILFIISEIFFFISFFWAFFHSSLSPSIEIGLNWPPKMITKFNPMETPLLNTMILLTSGLSITWCHHTMLMKNWKESVSSLLITIILGVYFSYLQYMEYYTASFTIADSIFGATFYMITGFHGIHVIIGTIFLSISCIRLFMKHFSVNHHIGFEASAWYWHFVDVVWLFVYIFIYW